MLTVTARLFKDNQLVGYRLSDGTSTQDFSKQQAWIHAKNKQILNVIAVGTEDDPGLSGTNGFELKRLPEVKMDTAAKSKEVFTTQDLMATKLRMILSGVKLNYSEPREVLDICKEQLKKEINSGKVVSSTVRSLSNNLEVLNTLGHISNNGAIAAGMPTGEVLERQKKEFLEQKNALLDLCELFNNVFINMIDAANTVYNETGNDTIPCEKIIDLAGRCDYSDCLQRVKLSKNTNLECIEKALYDIIGSPAPNDNDNTIPMSSIEKLSELQKILSEYITIIENEEYKPIRILMSTSVIIGYRLRYTGNIPLNTYRMTVTPDHTLTPYTIQPGQTICLSRAEMCILCSNPLIGCTLKNGKIVESSKKNPKDMYDALSSGYFTFNPSPDGPSLLVNDDGIKRPVTEFVDKKTIDMYFIAPESTNNNNTSSTSKTNNKSIDDRVKEKGLFGAFKR